jgi:hypothetical protein
MNVAKLVKGEFSCGTIVETQQRMKKHHAKVGEEKMRVVEFPGHQKVKAAMERHPAMVYSTHTAGSAPCECGTAKNPQTRWRHRRTAAPPPEPVVPLPGKPSQHGTPPPPPDDNEENESYEFEGILSRCVYMHSPLPNTPFFNHNAFGKNGKCDKDLIPDMLSPLSAVWKYR